jgi:hypothetical protein
VSDLHRLTLRALILRLLRDRIVEHEAANRAALSLAMGVGDRKTVQLPSDDEQDVPVGYATYAKGSTTAYVVDDAKFLAWVQANYPHEVETVSRVRPAFQRVVLDASKKFGAPMAPDGTLDVPGVYVRTGEPQLRIVPDKGDGAQLALIGAVRDDRTLLSDLLDVPEELVGLPEGIE